MTRQLRQFAECGYQSIGQKLTPGANVFRIYFGCADYAAPSVIKQNKGRPLASEIIRLHASVDGHLRGWSGVDGFRLKDGLAIEEEVIFDRDAVRDILASGKMTGHV